VEEKRREESRTVKERRRERKERKMKI